MLATQLNTMSHWEDSVMRGGLPLLPPKARIRYLLVMKYPTNI
jgi:hypothetical protein